MKKFEQAVKDVEYYRQVEGKWMEQFQKLTIIYRRQRTLGRGTTML